VARMLSQKFFNWAEARRRSITAAKSSENAKKRKGEKKITKPEKPKDVCYFLTQKSPIFCT